jgi:hypothetical protein
MVMPALHRYFRSPKPPFPLVDPFFHDVNPLTPCQGDIALLNVAFAGVSHKGSGKAQGIQLGAVLPLPGGEPEARARTLNNPGYIGERLDGAVSADHVFGLTLIL